MSTEVMEYTFPKEIQSLAMQVDPDKRNEVQLVLNHVFEGVSKMEAQLKTVVVNDHTDKVGMNMARTIRLGVREERLDAEKKFDAKRAEVQHAMISFKTEDALWLKAKQTMQILTKAIEENAKYKEDTALRHAEEQKELKTQERVKQVAKFAEVNRFEFENMGDNMFSTFLTGLEKAFNDKIEAERQAEEERLRQEKINRLHAERKESLIPYWDFVPVAYKSMNMGLGSEMEYISILEEAKQAKADKEAEIERKSLEAEKLKKEAEEKASLHQKRNSELRPYLAFIGDYSKMLNLPEDEYQKEFKDVQEAARQQLEYEAKKAKEQRLEEEARQKELFEARAAKEKADMELKVKADMEAKARAKELADQKAKDLAEKKAKSAPDKEKLVKLSKSIESMPLPDLQSEGAIALLADVKGLLKKIANHIDKNIDTI